MLEVGLLFEGGVERDVQLAGHQVGQPLPLAGAHPHHAGDVLHRRLGLEPPEGDDLRHVAVLAAHVVDHLPTAVLADVDIDVRILGAVGIGEPLEEQPVPLRAGVGEPQHVPDHRPHARAAGRGGDASLLGPVDDVPDDQEVGADELVREYLELPLEAGADLGGEAVGAVAPPQTGFAQVAHGAVAGVLELRGRELPVALGVVGQKLELRAERLEPRARIAGVVLR